MINNKLFKVFQKKHNIVIGALHFGPLLGYPEFPGNKRIENDALKDLSAFEKGGVDGIIFENNYDSPARVFVDTTSAAAMAYFGAKLKEKATVPLGVDVLWNDYRTALSLAKLLDLKFIRIPVFVDKVRNTYGDVIAGNPSAVREFRKKIGADNVALFVDVHVKHAKLLSKHDLATSARLAMKNSADAVIITGDWTGQAPSIDMLKDLRKKIGNEFPILVGSGADRNNIKEIFKYANGVIVSTALKKGKAQPHEKQVKKWRQRIIRQKVANFISAVY